jgi:hypothetical protein
MYRIVIVILIYHRHKPIDLNQEYIQKQCKSVFPSLDVLIVLIYIFNEIQLLYFQILLNTSALAGLKLQH